MIIHARQDLTRPTYRRTVEVRRCTAGHEFALQRTARTEPNRCPYAGCKGGTK